MRLKGKKGSTNPEPVLTVVVMVLVVDPPLVMVLVVPWLVTVITDPLCVVVFVC